MDKFIKKIDIHDTSHKGKVTLKKGHNSVTKGHHQSSHSKFEIILMKIKVKYVSEW